MTERLINIREPETIAGIDRKLFYSPNDCEEIIEGHKETASSYSVLNPYYKYTDKGAPMLLDIELSDGLQLQIGSIGAFTSEQMARMLQEQVVNYVICDTMGKKFPGDDEEKVDELVAEMIGGFSPDRVVVMFEKRTDKGINPVAGVQAQFVFSDNLLNDTIRRFDVDGSDGVERPVSSLPTFQAVGIVNDGGSMQSDFFNSYGSLPESKVVCMSRLYRQDEETSKMIGLDRPAIAWETMAALALGIARHAQHRDLELPEIVVYDTHNGGIQGCLERNFGMRLIAEAGETKPTPGVLSTILQYHYGSKEIGGYEDQIIAGCAPFDQYLEKAFNLLRKNGLVFSPSVPAVKLSKEQVLV